ncbi:MAG: aldolase/citrate lyase family protein [Pseudomonadota bacterium]
MTRDLRALLASDAVTLGTWTQIAAPELVDLLGLNGFDFTIFDAQHGPFGVETAERLSRAADANDIAAAIRLPTPDPVAIMKALDAGIRHVVIPNVESADQAARIVAATRFGPDGLRGACPCCRSGGHYIRDWQRYVIDEEGRTGAIALVETAEGARNIRAIAGTEGLAALMIGPFDLSVSMGHRGDWRHPEVTDAVARMVETAGSTGLPVMMPLFAPTRDECRVMLDDWTSRGVRCFVLGSDKILIADAFAGWSNALRPANAAAR